MADEKSKGPVKALVAGPDVDDDGQGDREHGAARHEGSSAATHQPSKVRAGMGDVGADFVEIYSDADYARATGLLSILAPDGRARTADVPNGRNRDLAGDLQGHAADTDAGRAPDDHAAAGPRRIFAEARGQEAAVIAPVAALGPSDWVVPSHREGGAGSLPSGCPFAHTSLKCSATSTTSAKAGKCPFIRRPARVAILADVLLRGDAIAAGDGIAWAAKDETRPDRGPAYLGEGATSRRIFTRA